MRSDETKAVWAHTSVHNYRPSPLPFSRFAFLIAACALGKSLSDQATDQTLHDSESKCSVCAGGKYALEATPSCANCPRGRYLTDNAQNSELHSSLSSCVICDAGTYNDEEALSTSCSVCSSGRYNIDTATAADQHDDPNDCLLCAAGKFLEDNAILASNHNTAESCIPCSRNTISAADGSSSCEDCPFERFSQTGSTSCYVCPPGNVCDADGNQTPCTSGKYSSGAEETCQECPPRYYCPEESDKIPCEPGDFQQSASQSTCDECPIGTFSDSIAAEVCTICDSGKYQASTKQIMCNSCGSGKYLSDITPLEASKHDSPDDCESCLAGESAPFSGSSACTICASGRWSSVGSSTCTACLTGKYLADDATAPALHNSENKCLICPSGQYNPFPGQSACELCVKGKYLKSSLVSNHDNANDCMTCDAGKYNNILGAGVCESCPAGTYAPSGSSTAHDDVDDCKVCGSGSYSGAGQGSCDSCVAGTYLSDDGTDASEHDSSANCLFCGFGEFSSDGAGTCTQCPVGKFNSHAATSSSTHAYLVSCETCLSGTYASSLGTTTCINCPAGSANSDTTSSAAFHDDVSDCEVCSSGRWSPEGSNDCTYCVAGRYLAYSLNYGDHDSINRCLDCEAGKSSPSSSGDCSICGKGKYSALGGLCTNCEQGRYLSDDGTAASEHVLSKCLVCDGGHYNLKPGSANCEPCVAGKVIIDDSDPSQHDSTEDCSICSEGKTSNRGDQFCSACSSGTYNPDPATHESHHDEDEDCFICKAGKYSEGVGNAECSDCPIGRYNADEATAAINHKLLASCSICPSGRYTPDLNTTSCIACAAGKFILDDGATLSEHVGVDNCENCIAGEGSEEGDSGCEICASGKYSSTLGTPCVDCEAGKFLIDDAISPNQHNSEQFCINCDAGTYSTTGSPECLDCSPGRSNPHDSSDHTEHDDFESDCQQCSPGKYQDRSNAMFCEPCPSKTFEENHGSTACSGECKPGFTAQAFVPEGAKSVDELSCSACFCAIGQVCDGVNEAGDAIFKTCLAGRYADRVGLTGERVRGAKRQADNAISSDELYTHTRTSAPPPLRIHGNNSHPSSKPLSRFASLIGLIECKLCQPGKFAANDMSGLCSDCLPGYISDEKATSCSPCPLGSRSSADNTECIKCDDGTFSGANPTNVCNLCPSGTIPTVQQESCQACPAGKFSVAGDSVCASCEEGSYASSGSSVCVRCLAGTISNEALTSCDTCNPGTFSSNGASRCEECDLGKVAQGGASRCDSCEAGKKSNSDLTSCESCLPGSYSGLGQGSCSVCGLGKYASTNNTRDKCNDCPSKQESNEEFTACKCKVGFVTVLENGMLTCRCDFGREFIESEGICSICRAGAYKNLIGDEQCTSCNQNAVKDSFDTTYWIMKDNKDDDADNNLPINSTSCACGKLYFLDPTPPINEPSFIGQCIKCPEETTNCDKPGITLATLPVKKGHWRSGGDSNVVIQCYKKSSCGRSENVTELFGKKNVDDQCTEGHLGPQCNVCEDNFVMGVLGGCERCPEGTNVPPQMIVAMALFIALLILLLFIIRKRIYAKLVQFHICGTNEEREALHAENRRSTDNNRSSNVSPRRGSVGMSPFSSDINGKQSPSFNVKFDKELTEEEMYHLRKNRNSIWNRAKTKGKILVACYQIISQYENILDVRYPELFESFGRWVESVMSLDALKLMAVGCVVPTTFRHTLLLATLGPMAVSACIYLFYMFITRIKLPKQRFHPDPRLDKEKRGFTARKLKDACYLLFLGLTYLVFNSVSTTIFKTFQCGPVGGDTTEYLRSDQSINCDSPDHKISQADAIAMIFVFPVGITSFYFYVLVKNRKELRREERDRNVKLIKIAFLWEMYKPKFWYFEIIECVRRLMMTGMLVLVSPGDATQVAVAMLFAIISIVLYTHLRPFENPHDNRLAIVSQWAIFFTLFAAMLIKTEVDDDDDYNQTLFGIILVLCNCTAFALAIWQGLIPITETAYGIIFHKKNQLTESQMRHLKIRGLKEYYKDIPFCEAFVDHYEQIAKFNGKVHAKLWSELEPSGVEFRNYNMALMTSSVEEAGWTNIEEEYEDDDDFKYWIDEWLTGAEAHWRCSSPDDEGSGTVDQVRVRFPIYQEYKKVREFFMNEDGEKRHDEEQRSGFAEYRPHKIRNREPPLRKIYSVVKKVGPSIPVFGFKKREFVLEEWREDMKYQSENGESDCLLVTARSIREDHIRSKDDTHSDGYERGELELYSFLLKDCGNGGEAERGAKR